MKVASKAVPGDAFAAATLAAVTALLGDSLGLDPHVTQGLERDSALFGNLPELDSMAVATVLTALEDRFHILIDDDEVTGELFLTVGSLADFVAGKVAALPAGR